VQATARKYVLALSVILVIGTTDALRGADISLCQQSCVCITWVSGASAYIEVRCRDGSGGWTSSPTIPPDGSDGTWQGSGSMQTAPSPLPGTALSGETAMAVTSAKGTAVTKLRGEKVPDMKNTWVPTKCTDLFANNPLGTSGADLLGRDIIFRDGTGVKDANNVDVCAAGTVSLWTKCCEHSPVVFVCSTFTNLSPSLRITKLIHETLHVAGQFEDTDSSVGPGDPPNPGQIDSLVNAACN